MINVLIAEDSTPTRMYLQRLLESDPEICVIGAVEDGYAVLEFLQQTRPDVILMDVYMPRLDGLEATRRIMETQPVPVVICSATANDLVFRSLEAGALACIEKPLGGQWSDTDATVRNLLQTVKLMAEIKVVRRRPKTRKPFSATDRQSVSTRHAADNLRVVGVGTSTGGPPALQVILAGLPKDFPVPILVVQHIAKGFLPGMIDWLRQTTGIEVHHGQHGALPLPGHVYLAPDDCHMGLGPTGHILLSDAPPENGLRPAVGFLFRSLVRTCGPRALGVLLTGMGRDGAAELKEMKDCGAITIAQDQETSIVHGMPGAAIALNGATHVLSLGNIADTLICLSRSRLKTLEGNQ